MIEISACNQCDGTVVIMASNLISVKDRAPCTDCIGTGYRKTTTIGELRKSTTLPIMQEVDFGCLALVPESSDNAPAHSWFEYAEQSATGEPIKAIIVKSDRRVA